jgi:hypothetical protein
MRPTRTAALLPALLLVAGCGGGAGDDAGKPAPQAAAPTTVPAPGRTIGEGARVAMKTALAGETGRTVWIYSQPGNAEVAALVESLSAVFRDAGWQVSAEKASGISLKPGIMSLVAEEQYPPYVDAVLKALDASGLGARSASGYRAYYQDKKKENPAWPGVPMRPDQDFLIVVGPKPPAPPAP